MSTCPYCQGEYELGVHDYWDDRTFTLMSCCEQGHIDAVDDLNEGVSRREFVDWFYRETGVKVRGYVMGADHYFGRMVLDWGLRLGEVSQAVAKDFVSRHHRHCKPPVGWRWGHGVFNGNDLIGVAMVGRPVARSIDGKTVVEVNRVCVDPAYGRLAWNACSMLYGAARREARSRGFTKIITYTLQSEAGVTLRAAGFTIKADVPARRRGWRSGAPTEAKYRWESAA